MKESALTFLWTFFTMFATAVIPLMIYAVRKAGRDFRPAEFVILSQTRLVITLGLVVLVSLVLSAVPETRAVIASVGLAAGASDAAIGLAIGGLCVAAISGDEK